MDVKNGSTINNVSYSYDSMGRITSEVDSVNTNVNTTYVYDSFGQLVRENNKLLDKTLVYKYNGIDEGKLFGEIMSRFTIYSERIFARLFRRKNILRILERFRN